MLAFDYKTFFVTLLIIISQFFYPLPVSREIIIPSNQHSNKQEPSTVSKSLILGQSLIVGIPEPVLDQSTTSLLRDIKPGGIVLYQRNFCDFSQLQKLIQSLQSLAFKTTSYPYYIMLDEEPEGALRTGLLKNIPPELP